MTPFTTMRKIALIAVAIVLSASQPALAQSTPTPEAVGERLTQQLTGAQTTLAEFEHSLSSAKTQLDAAFRSISRVEQEFKAGRPVADAYRELMSIAHDVDGIESGIELTVGRISSLRELLVGISDTALRYELFDIYRYANQAINETDVVARTAGALLEETSMIKDEITRIASSMRRR